MTSCVYFDANLTKFDRKFKLWRFQNRFLGLRHLKYLIFFYVFFVSKGNLIDFILWHSEALIRSVKPKLPIFAITKTCLCKYVENFTFKNWKIQIKTSDIFHISAQNIDCGYTLEPPRRGGSIEYPQSTFLSRNKKNNVYPCKHQFYHIKVGFKGVKIIGMFS